MTHLRQVFFVFVVLTTFTSCAQRRPAQVSLDRAEKARSGDVVILATTDFHATIDRAEAFVATLRETKQRLGDRAITVSAGDLFQGSMEDSHSRGRTVIDVFNLAGMDAVAMGNHDIDYGPDRDGPASPRPGERPRGALEGRVRQSRFPWLSANVVYKAGMAPKTSAFTNALGEHTLFAPHKVFTANGRKIGVIGATTVETPHITFPAFIPDVDFKPLAPVVAAEAHHLREKERCDLVLLVAHAGLECGEDGRCLQRGQLAEILHLLEELPAGTLDGVVAGHTHLKAYEVINGTPVIEAQAHGKVVGLLHFPCDTKGCHREGAWGEFLETDLPPSGTAAVADVTARLKPYREAAARQKARLIGRIASPLIHERPVENALNNAFAAAFKDDASRRGIDVDVGIMNTGGVRASLKGPKVTYGDVFKAHPFENMLTVAELRGHELRRLVEIGVSGAHGVSGFAGLDVVAYQVPTGVAGPWDRDINEDGTREQWERNLVKEIFVGGKPLDDEANYRVATTDFLTQGGDHGKIVYGKIEPARIRVYYDRKARDAFADFIARRSQKGRGIASEDFLGASQRRVQWIPYSPESPRN